MGFSHHFCAISTERWLLPNPLKNKNSTFFLRFFKNKTTINIFPPNDIFYAQVLTILISSTAIIHDHLYLKSSTFVAQYFWIFPIFFLNSQKKITFSINIFFLILNITKNELKAYHHSLSPFLYINFNYLYF